MIEQQVTVLNYPFAAALSVVLMSLVLLVTAAVNRYLGARPLGQLL